MKKTLIAISVLGIAVIFFAFYIYNIIKQEEYISTQFIEIDEVVIEDDEWIVKGLLNIDEKKSFIFKKGFSGFDFKEENGIFYLSLRYGVVSGEPSESFEVYLGDKLDNVKKVYLQGNSSDDVKLILEK